MGGSKFSGTLDRRAHRWKAHCLRHQRYINESCNVFLTLIYVFVVNNKEAGTEGMVRVVNPTSGHRALIKGMTSEVLDLQFAHLKRQIMLGCIEAGALHIHKIDNLGDKIVCTLLLKIEDSTTGTLAPTNKISWCPYVPENELEIDEYSSQQLVWIRGSTYQCYSIRSVINMYGVRIKSGFKSATFLQLIEFYRLALACKLILLKEHSSIRRLQILPEQLSHLTELHFA